MKNLKSSLFSAPLSNVHFSIKILLHLTDQNCAAITELATSLQDPASWQPTLSVSPRRHSVGLLPCLRRLTQVLRARHPTRRVHAVMTTATCECMKHPSRPSYTSCSKSAGRNKQSWCRSLMFQLQRTDTQQPNMG